MKEARLSEFEALRNLLPCLEHHPGIAGVGNELRADDVFGIAVARAIDGRVSIPVFDTGMVPENFLGKIAASGVKNLIMLDAVDFGGTVGEIRLVTPSQLGGMDIGTHLLSFQLAEMFLGAGGTALTILAVQPGSLQLGAAVSPPVEEAIEAISDFLISLYRK